MRSPVFEPCVVCGKPGAWVIDGAGQSEHHIAPGRELGGSVLMWSDEVQRFYVCGYINKAGNGGQYIPPGIKRSDDLCYPAHYCPADARRANGLIDAQGNVIDNSKLNSRRIGVSVYEENAPLYNPDPF